MQLLFFCLIPVGIIILIFGIKLLQKVFNGDIIPEIPYSQKSSELIISEPGHYSIRHKGQFFRKAPLDEFRPEITKRTSGEDVTLTSLLLGFNTNSGQIFAT